MIEKLKFYKNFPIDGINFVDIMPFLQSKENFAEIMDALCEAVTAPTVAAPEARGFLFSSPLLTMKESCVENVIPVRKPGKLPFNEGDLVKVNIVKEYGSDTLTYRISDLEASKVNDGVVEVTVLDDVLATGGTMVSLAESLLACKVNGCPIKIKEFVVLVEIDELNGRARLEKYAPVKALMHI